MACAFAQFGATGLFAGERGDGVHMPQIWYCELEMCMGIGFPMGPGIPWESHGNGNRTQHWEWEWEGMGNHLSGNGNYLHSHGNLFPKGLCCDELIK